MYGPDIHRNGGRDAPWPCHSALLEPVLTPFSSDTRRMLTTFGRRYSKYKDTHGTNEPPPEFRLRMGQVGAVLAPIGLFWLAFTTTRDVHWIVPILATVPFGTATYFIFTSSMTYIVDAYQSAAVSALTCNAAMRTIFAAAFPLFAGQMYNKLGTVGATSLLAGLTTVMAPLP